MALNSFLTAWLKTCGSLHGCSMESGLLTYLEVNHQPFEGKDEGGQ